MSELILLIPQLIEFSKMLLAAGAGAGLGFYGIYFLVLRDALAEMRVAVYAASSAGLGSTAFGVDRAAAAIENVQRLKLWVRRVAIALVIVGFAGAFVGGLAVRYLGVFVVGYLSYHSLSVVTRSLSVVTQAVVFFAFGMLLRGFQLSVEIDRARMVLKARSEILASIGEDRVSDATVVLQARGERDEQRYRQNLSAQFEIKYFELHAANIFRDLSWNLEPRINVLLGRNGFGKSFLLRLLLGMVAYDNDRLAKLLTNPDQEQRLAVRLLRNGEPGAIERGPVAFDEAVGKISVLAIPDLRFVSRTRSISAEGDEYADLARYGGHHFLYELPYDTTIQTVLAQMCIEVTSGGSLRGRPTSPQLDLVSEVIRELSGERFVFHRIEPIGQARFSIEVETDSSPGRPISIQQASQGTLSVVVICALIYQYLRAVQPSIPESESCKQHAIVIIDEVDAHLHPAWQRKIVPLLRKHFPNVQFILTAHSPLVVAGCGLGEVSVLRRQNASLEVVDLQKDFVGATSKDIYRDLFEIEERDVRFLELQAELPRLSDRRRELEGMKAARPPDPSRIRNAEEAIRSIERTREDQEARLSYQELERENTQLRRQIEGLRKHSGEDVT